MTATPPKPSLVKTTALSMVQAVTDRLNVLLPTVQSAESPVTVFQAGTPGVGAQLNAPTSAFPAGAGYYGVWTAPDLNNGNPYTVQVECFGGGGGGGGGSATSGGGGGGGGEYAAERYYPVRPGTDYVWQVGVPGSAGTANNDNNQGATAGGTGGTTIFDIAGTGVAGGVTASGGQGGDAGNTGNGGLGGSGSLNTLEYGGGTGGTNLPGGGGGSGGQGGTDNPLTLFSGGLLNAAPVAWYILNDTSSGGLVNDSSGSDNPAANGSWSGSSLVYGQALASSQVPAYAGLGGSRGTPNNMTASGLVQFPLHSLTQPSGYIQTPGIFWQNTQLTCSGWIMPDNSGTWGNSATGSRAVLAANCSGFGTGSPAGTALYLKNNGTASNPFWELIWYAGNGSVSQLAVTALPATPHTPVYVVATFSSGTLKLYVNGTLADTEVAGFSSVPSGNYAMTLGMDPALGANWFFGYMSNFWFANGVLSSAGITQAFSGAGGGGSTNGGAGGGASGGPEAVGGAGSAGSGSAGGAGGTPATQPAADVGLSTPASPGIGGAAGGSGNSGLTGAAGAGGGGAGSSSSPPNIVTLQVPFTTASSYCGTDATGGAAGTVYNPVIQGTTGRLFTGGQSNDGPSGSKNSLLILPPNLAATFSGGTVLRVTLTVTTANPQAAQNALMQVGWAADSFLPITYTASDIAGSAGIVEIPAGAFTITADLTESLIGNAIAAGTATALVLGPGPSPTFAAYNADTAADFYTAVYGPGATDTAGNSLAPFLTVTYAQSTTVQQGSPGGSGAVLVTFLNPAETLVGSWNSATGIQASGGQITETTVVLGSTILDGGALDASEPPALLPAGPREPDLDALVRQHVAVALKEMVAQGRIGERLGAVPGAPGTLLGYTAGTTTVSQTTPGSYTFTIPAGVTSLAVSCWGAGAGAIGGTTGQGQGGGGGGAYAAEPNYAVTAGQVLHYTVGTGGPGRGDGNSTASPGGSSIFDSTSVAGSGITANGGSSFTSSRGYGPGGGTSGNTVSFSGGNGGPFSGQSNGSGGGGSAGAGGNGGGGNSGGTHGGAGAGGGAAGGNGSTNGSGSGGSAPGGGGGGASHGSVFTGGSGGNGKVTFTYVSSTVLNTSVATASGTDTAGNAYPAGVMTNALQVNGTTTSTNTTVSGTTSTGTLTVTANASVAGNHTVTGNVAVGGVITGASGGTLESSTGIHAAGTGQFDGGVNTAGISASGVVATTGLNSSGQVLAGGASSGSTLAVLGSAHITSTATIDGGVSTGSSVNAGQVLINASGGLDLEVGGGGHIGGGLEVDGTLSANGGINMSAMNGASLPQGAVSNPSLTSPSANEVSLASAINGVISRIRSVGIIP